MDDELLIDLVESCPCLYDHNDRAFKNTAKRERMWQHIADKMETDVNYVKRRWVNLRERFGKESRQAPPPDAYDSDFVPPKRWALLDRLQFLKRHILPRPQRRGPITNKIIRVNETSFKLDPLEIMEAETKMEPTSSRASETQNTHAAETRSVSSAERDSHSRVRSRSRSGRSASPTRSPSPSARSPSPKRSKRERRKKEAVVDFGDVDKVMFETANIFQKLCEQKSRKPAMDAEISGFTTMIGAMVSKLRTKRRITVIQRCTEIVMQASMEEEDDKYFK